jgi:hypothetical protein
MLYSIIVSCTSVIKQFKNSQNPQGPVEHCFLSSGFYNYSNKILSETVKMDLYTLLRKGEALFLLRVDYSFCKQMMSRIQGTKAWESLL